MLDEGLVFILATDAHNLRNRVPIMSEAREAVAERLGEGEAELMVLTRPLGMTRNEAPETLPQPLMFSMPPPKKEWLRGLFGRSSPPAVRPYS